MKRVFRSEEEERAYTVNLWASCDAMEEMHRRRAKNIRGKVKKALETYKDLELKAEIDAEPPSEDELEQFNRDYMANMMENREDVYQQVLDELMKNRVAYYEQFKELDCAIECYRKSCERSANKVKKLQYDTLKKRYLDDTEWSVAQIAEYEQCDERTVQKYLERAIDELILFVPAKNFLFAV